MNNIKKNLFLSLSILLALIVWSFLGLVFTPINKTVQQNFGSFAPYNTLQQLNSLASSTIMIVPPEANDTFGMTGVGSLLFGTNTARIYLAITATTTQYNSFYVSLFDVPCTATTSAFILNASTTYPFEFYGQKNYTGAIRVCSTGAASSSLMAIQANYN